MEKHQRAVEAAWFGLGLACGMIVTHLLTRAIRPLAHWRYWEQALAERYGKQKAALLAARMQARYEALFKERLRFSNSALRDHFEGHILPAIALYQVLQEETGSSAEALDLVDRCFSAHIQASREAWQMRLLDGLPGNFELLRIANRAALRNGFPAEGWQVEWVEDSPQRIAYDITDCFYLNVFRQYGVPELTAHCCTIDDQLYGHLRTIAWERTETLGRGDARCNFVLRPRQA